MTMGGDFLKGAVEAIGGRVASAALEPSQKKGVPTPPKGAKKGTRRRGKAANHSAHDAIAEALHDLRRSKSDDAPLDDFREELFSELRKLIPIAIQQARGTAKTPPRP